MLLLCRRVILNLGLRMRSLCYRLLRLWVLVTFLRLRSIMLLLCRRVILNLGLRMRSLCYRLLRLWVLVTFLRLRSIMLLLCRRIILNLGLRMRNLSFRLLVFVSLKSKKPLFIYIYPAKLKQPSPNTGHMFTFFVRKTIRYSITYGKSTGYSYLGSRLGIKKLGIGLKQHIKSFSCLSEDVSLKYSRDSLPS
ncbi:hypothetical protein AABM17_763 [Neisseria musculi]|uniref:Uncharacterized protein n=1 Tax=Neisseria musculi TaxID=1815583 RepID=A0A7H1MA21_9NEIS|nr:hypothetical protein H7A79_0762 [Neisseria musculi]